MHPLCEFSELVLGPFNRNARERFPDFIERQKYIAVSYGCNYDYSGPRSCLLGLEVAVCQYWRALSGNVMFVLGENLNFFPVFVYNLQHNLGRERGGLTAVLHGRPENESAIHLLPFQRPDGKIRSSLRLSDVSRYRIRLPHGLSGFAGIFDRSTGQHDLPIEASQAEQSGPKAKFSPKRTLLGSMGRAPLGAQIGFAFALWLVAWGAILRGTGDLGGRPRRIRGGYLLAGIAIAGIPLLWII